MTVAKRTKQAKPDPALVKLADSLLDHYQKPEDLIGENGLPKRLTKILVERALKVEISDHLGHDKSGEVTNETANTRNGHSAKMLKGDFGALPLDIPHDRQGAFGTTHYRQASDSLERLRRQGHLAVCARPDGQDGDSREES